MTSYNMFLQCPYRSSLFPNQPKQLSQSKGKRFAQLKKGKGQPPRQQDDQLKEHYMNIVEHGLQYAYDNAQEDSPKPKKMKCRPERSIIVVGAGASGLAAAYELERAGYKTTILELQHRVGGRLKTISDGFSDGLHAEGGAMRIPPNHYLTHAYIEKFNIKLRPFTNYNEETFVYLDRERPIKTKDWMENNAHYSDLFFPGWNDNIAKDVKPKVKGINDYYDRTMKQVKDDLDERSWEDWVEHWSKYSVNTFLRYEPDPADSYRPWPETAIRGLQVSTYSPSFDISLVEHLRDEIGEWWVDPLETPVDGMETIAKHFVSVDNSKLFKRVHFGHEVIKIAKQNNGVCVTCRNTATGDEVSFEGDAVIVTVPLTILRQMDVDMETETRRAVSYFHYESSSKILLQCRTRFWEKDVGQGGFSKTDMPIGQVHYPSKNNPPHPNPRGILVCYTWGQDALIFGSQSEKQAVASAVREVAKIHPEMEKEFEVGRMQAWYSDSTAQGAYASLAPYQYNDGMKQLMEPNHPIHLAGEAISYTNGWIQGAIESGLRAAYQLYSHYQH